MMTVQQVCEVLQISRGALMECVENEPGFPQPKRVGPRLLRFKRTEVAQYVDSRCISREPGQVA